MVGGLFLFGILGLILGPLILAYLLIFLEIYRKDGSPGILIQKITTKLPDTKQTEVAIADINAVLKKEKLVKNTKNI